MCIHQSRWSAVSESRPGGTSATLGGDAPLGAFYWAVILRHRFVVLGVALVIIVGVTLWALLATPIYRSVVVMVSNLEDESPQLPMLGGQLGGLASLAGFDLGSGRDEGQEALATLRSRAFSQRFIVEHGLLQAFFAEQWDAETGTWILEDDQSEPSPRRGFRVLDQRVRFIEEDVGTGVIRLVVEWRDPALAARWANQLVADINELLRADAIKEAEKSIAYLNRELEKSSVIELRQAIYRLIESQVQQVMVANVRDEYAFKIIDPATVAEPSEYVRPNKVLMVGLALFFGPAAGIAAALFLAFLGGLREVQRSAGQPNTR